MCILRLIGEKPRARLFEGAKAPDPANAADTESLAFTALTLGQKIVAYAVVSLLCTVNDSCKHDTHETRRTGFLQNGHIQQLGETLDWQTLCVDIFARLLASKSRDP